MKFDRPTRKKRAREASFDLPHDLVAHPRAREMAQASPHQRPAMSVDEMRARVSQLRNASIVPGSAVLARAGHPETGGYFDRAVYADVVRQCAACARPFMFYANEQRYWFETLLMPADVECKHCVPCRRQARRVKAAHARYQAAVHAPRLDAKDMKTFVDDALLLFEVGAVRNPSRLGAIKNRAQRELAGYAGTQALAHALATARAAAAMGPFARQR